MLVRWPMTWIFCLLLACCSSKQDASSLTDEIIAVQVSDNQQRCTVKESALMRCEYESWGAEKIVVKIESTKATYHNVSSKELGVQFELDDRFPSLNYKIGRDKDLLYTQLEQSGYCAFSEVEKEKKDDKKSKKSHGLPRTLFIPAMITTGLTDDGVVFLRKWSLKKSSKKKQPDQGESRPAGFGPSQQTISPQANSEHEQLTLDCVVASRGSDELGPAPADKDKSDVTSKPHTTDSPADEGGKSKSED